jgi:predicted RNA-binding Zn ribbon-like protein
LTSFNPSTSAPQPLLIGDHPALDMLNTIAVLDSKTVDFWEKDEDVLNWLEQANLITPDDVPALKPHALRNAAQGLRDVVRTLLDQRKAGGKVDVAALNAFLARGQSTVQLIADEGDTFHIERRYERRTAEQLLTPLAESAAELLANGDFSLVRKCEHPDCVLHFYDRTKSHRRRWCSMAICGNRHKVAQFRRRQEQ